MIEYLTIRGSAVGAFRHMTFPAYRAALNLNAARPARVLVGAKANSAAIGLAFAAIASRGTGAELLSMYVDGDYRNRGVATALVEKICAELIARGVETIRATYMTGQPTTAAVERVFAKTGWSAPQTRMLVVRFTLDSVAGAPWITHFRMLPAGYDIVPWVELTADERTQLRTSQERDHWIAEDLVPFDFESGIEPITSLALRYRGEVVGWCLTHIIGDVLRFTCSYIRRDLARLGRVLPLYSEAITRMPRTGLVAGMWAIPVHHASFARFAQRRMQPYFVFFGETRGVRKSLVSQAQVDC
jgi:GNAT superfamily N-acetyltransferase